MHIAAFCLYQGFFPMHIKCSATAKYPGIPAGNHRQTISDIFLWKGNAAEHERDELAEKVMKLRKARYMEEVQNEDAENKLQRMYGMYEYLRCQLYSNKNR